MQRDTLSTFIHAHFTIMALEMGRIECFHILFFPVQLQCMRLNRIQCLLYYKLWGKWADLQQFIIKDSFNVNLFHHCVSNSKIILWLSGDERHNVRRSES